MAIAHHWHNSYLMYKKLIFFLCVFGFFSMAKAQQHMPMDSVINKTGIDSLAEAQMIELSKPISPAILLLPKEGDSLNKITSYPVFDLQSSIKNHYSSTQVAQFQEGNVLDKGEVWIIGAIATLMILFAFLRYFFAKQLTAIVQSFFSNRVLANLNKEDNLFTSWPFLLLFVQFGFTIGMFIYLTAQYKQLSVVAGGFQFFISVSISIVLLYAFKIIILRLVGFFFNIQKPINGYISILYLSYFNAALLFMPLVVAFALSPIKYGEFYVIIALILFAIIFTVQLIRAGVNILSQHRFSKVYLFLYFCTLEICPILILIRAIGF